MKGEPQCMTALDLVQRFSAVRLSTLFPFEVLKGLKGEVVVVSRFGRTFLPKWKLHFLLNPWLPLVISSSFSIRPLEEWVSQARLGPLDSTSEGFQLCRSESGKAGCSGVSSAAGFVRIACKPSHWSAPAMQADLREFQNFIQKSLCRMQFCGSHPSPL